MTEIIEPVESQELYEFVLNNRTKLPPKHEIRNITLTSEDLKQIYDIVAINRAKTRGTRLNLESNDNGDLSKIEYEEVKIPPQDIVTPTPKDKRK